LIPEHDSFREEEMECFAKRGWWSPAVSKAGTDIENMLKVFRGKAVEDPSLKTL